MHYSCRSRRSAGFLKDLDAVPWKDRVHFHATEEGSRADLSRILAGYRDGFHVYICGPERYMQAVLETAARAGYPEDARHLEYFSVPEVPAYENFPFTLRLRKSVLDIRVPADRTAADVLGAQGFAVDIKCADGLCGVCQCRLVAGEVEHRDFVLSRKMRETTIILCQSRAAAPDGVIEIDL
jgi:ferredoxin